MKTKVLLLGFFLSTLFCFGQNNVCIPASTLVQTQQQRCYGNWYTNTSDSRIQYRVRGPIETKSSTLDYDKTQMLYRWDIEFKYTGNNAICANSQEYEGNINNFSTRGCYFPGETHTDVAYTLSSKGTIKIDIDDIEELTLEPNGTANAVFDKKGRAWYSVLENKDKKTTQNNSRSNQNKQSENKQNANNTQKITSLEQVSTASEESLRQLSDNQLKDLIVEIFKKYGQINGNVYRDDKFLYLGKADNQDFRVPFSNLSYPARFESNEEKYFQFNNNGTKTLLDGYDYEGIRIKQFYSGYRNDCIIQLPRLVNNSPDVLISNQAVSSFNSTISFMNGNQNTNIQTLLKLIRLLNLKQYSSNEVFTSDFGLNGVGSAYNYFSSMVNDSKKNNYIWSSNKQTVISKTNNGNISTNKLKVNEEQKETAGKIAADLQKSLQKPYILESYKDGIITFNNTVNIRIVNDDDENETYKVRTQINLFNVTGWNDSYFKKDNLVFNGLELAKIEYIRIRDNQINWSTSSPSWGFGKGESDFDISKQPGLIQTMKKNLEALIQLNSKSKGINTEPSNVNEMITDLNSKKFNYPEMMERINRYFKKLGYHSTNLTKSSDIKDHFILHFSGFNIQFSVRDNFIHHVHIYITAGQIIYNELKSKLNSSQLSYGEAHGHYMIDYEIK